MPVGAAASSSAVLEEVLPALAARDTLRLEADLPPPGHELGPGITPVQAGLSRVVGSSRQTSGVGIRSSPSERPAWAAACGAGDGPTPSPPAKAGRCFADDRPVGEVTSGNYSPVLALGSRTRLLPPNLAVGPTASS
ncbi:MAG: hypothetical protein ACRD0L_15970 [Acidimicrobiales bacterium]